MRTRTDHALNGTSTDALRGGNREVDGDRGDGRGLGNADGDKEAAPRDFEEGEARMMRAVKMIEKEIKGGRGAPKDTINTRRKRGAQQANEARTLKEGRTPRV
jgi:hypothetical protein